MDERTGQCYTTAQDLFNAQVTEIENLEETVNSLADDLHKRTFELIILKRVNKLKEVFKQRVIERLKEQVNTQAHDLYRRTVELERLKKKTKLWTLRNN
jgi:hypothetical protein